MRRAARAVLVPLALVALTSCTTLIDGKALKAPHDITADGTDLALLDPGNYPTTPAAPLGTAGSQRRGIVLEGHRMADNVVVPTDVDKSLTEGLSMNTVTMQQDAGISAELPDPGQAIVTAHNMLAGFASGRRDKDNTRALINMVLRFPDAGAASDAAQQLSTQIPPPVPKAPFPVPRYPTALGATMDTNAPTLHHAVEAYLPHGPYLLYAWGESAQSPDDAAGLVAGLFDQQIPKIDAFAPTDAAKLADLPQDPFGFLSRVLPADNPEADVDMGSFGAYAELHFQDGVAQAAADFAAAGVDAAAREQTVLYRARDAAGARLLVDSAAKWALTKTGAKATDGVPGMPSAKCFEFTQPEESNTPRFGCFAPGDRFEIEAWSQQGRDVRQQVAAQYLMLTST
ncbi:MAG: hypothetical protein JO280_18215 [Mycobacteriaceae bacterium]|nr:hypothetical protein [Mycobacteriaceae bacterium]